MQIAESGLSRSAYFCGITTHLKAGINTKTALAALELSCGACNQCSNPLVNQGWWLAFGPDRNPYFYGPMPRLRTSTRYRIEEARRKGWIAWTWSDEYKEERKELIVLLVSSAIM